MLFGPFWFAAALWGAAYAADPHPVGTGEYHLQASNDPSVLAGEATELWAQVWFPRDLLRQSPAQALPLVVMLHGNHETCGHGSNPRVDSGCEYTGSGTCPEGDVVVPNHLGYSYAAKELAAEGAWVVSINANRGINCNSGPGEDSGLNLARGRLVLRHLEMLRKWSGQEGGAPVGVGLNESEWRNRIDFARVGLMGHSRGGEGMRAALAQYRDPGSDWPSKVPGLDIRAIFEIGAVDGQSSRILDAYGVAWNQLLPLCDGDVSDLQGRMPFERMTASPRGERSGSQKSILTVWGANHNFFNTEWQESDSSECIGAGNTAIFDPHGMTSLLQQSVGRSAMSAFFQRHVLPQTRGALEWLNPLLGTDPRLVAPIRFDRTFTAGDQAAEATMLDSFSSELATASGLPRSASGVGVALTGASPRRLSVSWTTLSPQNTLGVHLGTVQSPLDLRSASSLDFRVRSSVRGATVDFSIVLVDVTGRTSVPLASSGFFHGQPIPHPTAELFPTVRIPVSRFSGIDLSRIVEVRWVFDRMAAGTIELAQLRLSGVSGLRPPLYEPLLTGNSCSVSDVPASLLVSSVTADLIRGRRDAHVSRIETSGNDRKIHILSDSRFPVLDALAELQVGEVVLRNGVFGARGDTRELIFTWNVETHGDLEGEWQLALRYGSLPRGGTWNLGNLGLR